MSTTITLDAAILERVLANGILFAAPSKDYLPALEVVRFDWDGDTLMAVATNRYVLSVETVPYHGDGNTDGRDVFSVGTSDAKRVIAMLKALRSPSFPVAVKYDSEANKVTFLIDGDQIIVSAEHGEFPKWRNLVPAGDATGPVDTISLGANWLGLLAKVKSDWKGAPVKFTFNGTKPVGAEIGEHFRAVIVPIKNAA